MGGDVGGSVGDIVGPGVGAGVGLAVGAGVGDTVGDDVGEAVGGNVGDGVGKAVGTDVGDGVGGKVGGKVGGSVGASVGSDVSTGAVTLHFGTKVSIRQKYFPCFSTIVPFTNSGLSYTVYVKVSPLVALASYFRPLKQVVGSTFTSLSHLVPSSTCGVALNESMQQFPSQLITRCEISPPPSSYVSSIPQLVSDGSKEMLSKV